MRRIHPLVLVAALVLAASVLLEARQLWTSSASGTSTSGTMHVGGVVTAGSGPTTLTNGTGQLLEAAIADGSVLARVGSNETVTGAWTFNSAAGVSPTVIADAAALTLRLQGRASDSLAIISLMNNAGSGIHGQVRGDSGQLRLYAGTTPTNVLDMSATGITARVPLSNTSRYNSASAQPGFLAYNSNIDVGVSTGATIDFDTETYDNAGNFSADTFTAPVTGQYEFKATVSTTYTPDGGILTIALVTTGASYRCDTSDATVLVTVTSHCLTTVPMTAGDTALVQLTMSGTGSEVASVNGLTTPRVTWFSGRLVP